MKAGCRRLGRLYQPPRRDSQETQMTGGTLSSTALAVIWLEQLQRDERRSDEQRQERKRLRIQVGVGMEVSEVEQHPWVMKKVRD